MTAFEVLSSDASRLGECPIWCDRTQRLWWVDVLEPTLWSHDPVSGACRRHALRARRLGSLALRRDGGLILACEDGLYRYDPESGEQVFVVDPEPGIPGHRKNDGRADWTGNFWIGTLKEDDYAPVGAVYRVASDKAVSRQATYMAIPNGLAFDEARQRVYFADTRAHTIWVAPYDGHVAQMEKREVFARTTAPARPDGSCVDSEGFVWNAEYAGGRLVRYAPSGKVADVIQLPVSHPTCCCFGGDALDRMYVTSAVEPLTNEQRAVEPLAGRVIVLDVGVRGKPEHRVNF